MDDFKLSYRGVEVPAGLYHFAPNDGREFNAFKAGIDAALGKAPEPAGELSEEPIQDKDGDYWWELMPGLWTLGYDRADAAGRRGEGFSQYIDWSADRVSGYGGREWTA
jgi:hypothetical protein